MEEIDLTNFFHTKSQANDFSIRIANLSDKLYETGFNLEKVLIDNLGLQKKEKFMSLLRNNNVNTSSVSDLKSFFDKLQEKIKTLPTLSLSIAFEPNEKTLELLDEWFTLNLKKQFIFDIAVNTNLVGGAAINFNGKYLDCSIKTKFDKILLEVLKAEAVKPTPANPKPSAL
jgi:F0F1-type ATP synthase delta subunit